MSNIEIRHIDRTCLHEQAYNLLVQKYTKNFEHNVLIVFDKRIISFGAYIYSDKTQEHIIRISPTLNRCAIINSKYEFEEAKKDLAIVEKYNLICTTLHELKHARQYEEIGEEAYEEEFAQVEEIRDLTVSEWYATKELQAREFEVKYLREAIDFYNNIIENETVD